MLATCMYGLEEISNVCMYMYVCVCVCMCVYICVYIYIYIYIYIIYNFIYQSINNLQHTRLFHFKMVTHYILGTYNIRYTLELITNTLPAFYILIMLKDCLLHLCTDSKTYVVSPYIHLLKGTSLRMATRVAETHRNTTWCSQ